MIDVKKQLVNALESGEIIFGSKKAVESLLNREPKMIVLSKDCPRDSVEMLSYYCRIAEVPLVRTKENSVDLGSGLGRSHPISTITVLDEGESAILEASK